jgi:MGT family glycosyltransferase
MLQRHLVLSPFPHSLRDPAAPLPATGRLFRDDGLSTAPARPRAEPVVYFTLGTVFNLECGDLFARVLAGLRELPVSVVATLGDQIDPDDLGPQPATIRIERYVPQSLVLPRCSAVVCHGGSGSVLGALAHGLPLVVIPMGADQPLNAARCEALGVGRVLDALRSPPDDIRAAVAGVLDEPRYRGAAERVRDEIATLAPASHAVALLERLARTR